MKRITELKPEWKAAIPEWNRQWIERGLSTEPADFAAFEAAARECYRFAGLEWPWVVVRVQSPLVGAFAASIASRIMLSPSNKVDSAVYSEVGSAVRSAVYSAVDSAVRSEVGSAVYSEVGSEVDSAVDSAVGSAVASAVRSAVDSAVYSEVGSEVGSAVYSAVRSAVRSAVASAVRSAVGSAVRSAVASAVRSAVGSVVDSAVASAVDSAVDSWHPWIGGRVWSGWHAFVLYFIDVCGLELPSDISDRARAYANAGNAGYWWPNSHFVMVSEPPTRLRQNAAGQLHDECDMAIRYSDGWGLWMLNGVRVPSWLVTTSAADIDPAKLVEIDNAEVRREFVRKIGAERVVSLLSRGPVDTATYRTADGREHPYELHRLEVRGEIWTYLRMQNPSIGVTHFEGVPNECLRVQDALNFRNGLRPEQVSTSGSEWYQQGDVLLFPRGAKAYQPFPSILT